MASRTTKLRFPARPSASSSSKPSVRESKTNCRRIFLPRYLHHNMWRIHHSTVIHNYHDSQPDVIIPFQVASAKSPSNWGTALAAGGRISLDVTPTKFHPRVISIPEHGTNAIGKSGCIGHGRRTQNRPRDRPHAGASGRKRGGELQSVAPGRTLHRKR